MPDSAQQNAYNAAQSTGKGVIYDQLGNVCVVGAQMPTGAASGNVLVSDASGNLTNQALPAATTSTPGAVILDGTATDIQPDGVQAAGSVGKSADAGHVHPWSSGEALTSGEAIFPRWSCSGSCTLVTQQLQLSYWVAVTSGTATTVTTQTAGTAASGLTYAAIGVYSVDGSGNLTRIATTGDLHSTLWTSTFTTYTSTLTTTFTRVAGTRYALGCLAVGTICPALLSPSGSNLYETAPILAALVGGQSTLPSSVAAGSVTATFAMAMAMVAP